MADESINPAPLSPSELTYPWSKIGHHPRQAFSEVLSYRPNKETQNAYWHLRDWCAKNGLNVCDFLNSILPALVYYCLNYTEKEQDEKHPDRIRAYVLFNMGIIPVKQFQNRRVHKNFTFDVADKHIPEEQA